VKSLLQVLATDPGQLIVVRAFMGVGAAAIMPTTLSVITTSFPNRSGRGPSGSG
jgi:MFS family permease